MGELGSSVASATYSNATSTTATTARKGRAGIAALRHRGSGETGSQMDHATIALDQNSVQFL